MRDDCSTFLHRSRLLLCTVHKSSRSFCAKFVPLFPILFYLLILLIMDSQKIVRNYHIIKGVLICECFVLGHSEPFLSLEVVLKDVSFKLKKMDCSLLFLRNEINVCLAFCEEIPF